MSETITSAAQITESPKAKKAPKVKAEKTKATAAPVKEKVGLRAPQVRILKCLAKATKPMTRSEISAKAPVDVAACVEYIGSHNPEVRKANDEKHFPSLITLGYVKAEMHDVDGRDVVQYSISARGKATAEKIK